MFFPNQLKTGDRVGILAPARKINRTDVEFAANVISSWGLSVVLSKNLYSTHHSYLSGNDAERIDDLQNMIDDPAIRCIICARGGYGSTRIIDRIDYSSLQKNPKWFVGFSDITAIHLKLFKHKIVSVHGTMPILFSKPDSTSSVESLRKLLLEGECKIEAPAFELNRSGETMGKVIGGNLSLIVDSLGTLTEPDTNNTILLLEEIDEYLYKVDRMITHLKRAGKLENLKGLIVGHMTDIKDTELSFGERVEEIILNAVKHFNYPVAFLFPSGHENPNYAWLHGADAKLFVTSSGAVLSYVGMQS